MSHVSRVEKEEKEQTFLEQYFVICYSPAAGEKEGKAGLLSSFRHQRVEERRANAQEKKGLDSSA